MSTADQILRKTLVQCLWPATNAPLTSAEILELLDDEISETLWPQLHAAQGDWHLAVADTDLVASRARYRMPRRMWGPLKELLFVDEDGEARDFQTINISQLGRMARESRPSSSDTAPYYAYVDGDFIGLHPIPSAAAGTLRVMYYRSPNALCLEAAARQISGITSSTVVQLETTITGWTSSSVVDIIGAGGSHQVVADGVGVASLVGTALTFDAALPDGVEVGDWVSLTGTTPVAQVPDNLIGQLISLGAAMCMASVGDDKGFARSSAKASDKERRAQNTLEPRNEAEPTIIRPRRGFFR